MLFRLKEKEDTGGVRFMEDVSEVDNRLETGSFAIYSSLIYDAMVNPYFEGRRNLVDYSIGTTSK